MCQFVGTYYYECQHVSFQLHLFCRQILYQLNRVNEELECDILPFDHDTPGCSPCTVMKGGIVDTTKNSTMDARSNVVQWITNLSDLCPSCGGP